MGTLAMCVVTQEISGDLLTASALPMGMSASTQEIIMEAPALFALARTVPVLTRTTSMLTRTGAMLTLTAPVLTPTVSVFTPTVSAQGYPSKRPL